MGVVVNLTKPVANKAPPSDKFLGQLAFKLGGMLGTIGKVIALGKAEAAQYAKNGKEFQKQYTLGGVAELEDWRVRLGELTEFCAKEWDKPQKNTEWQTGPCPSEGYFLAQMTLHCATVAPNADYHRVLERHQGDIVLAGLQSIKVLPAEVKRWKPI